MLPRIDNSSNSSRTDEYAESALLENRSVGRSLERNRDLTHRPRSATFHHNSGRNDEHSSNRLPIQYGLPRRVASKVIVKSFGQNGFESQVQSSPLTRDHIFQIPRRKRSQRLKPRSLQCIETVNELFTSFTLNRDPENSKYLSYNEVIYPKLFNRPTSWRSMAPTRGTLVNGKGGKRDSHLDAAAEMDSMWMVGFIEDARRHQKDTLLKELKYFIRLPDSTVLPNSRSTLDTISLMKTPTSFNSLATSASGRRDNVSAGQLLPGMSIRVEDVDHSENGAAGAGSSEGGKSALTPLENLRLRELERRLSQASLGISDREERRGAGIHAYTAANHKLRKILSGARPPALGPSLKSEGLEAVLHRNREELLAAIRIQRPFKLYFRRKKFGGMIRQLRGVARVQALVRGVVARKYVTEWHSRRSSMVCMWQTFIRRALSNNRRQRYLVVENRAATRLQAVARGGAGRNKARHTRANLAALRIQCLWRGSVDRARADRMWLDTLVTRVQGLVRVMSAKRKVERKRRIYSDASRTIQCCFRGTLARGKMARMIWERSIHQRMTFIRSLASEEDKERESMAVMQRRWNMAQLNERLEEALSAESAAHALVFNLESNEQELQTHRLMLSPRGLQQGWKEEIDNNIEQHRDWITKRKLEAVFSASLTARTLEEEVKRRDELLADWKRRLMQLARWRDVEMRGILDREARRRFDEQHLAERRKIAEEKRKWAVKYVTPSGKPDKLKTRRRSRPWEAFEDPVEGVLKQVFTGGRVDLFANERSPEEALEEAVATRGQGGMPATAWSDGGRVEKVGANVLMSGSLEQVAACLKLQAYDKQVMQLDEVMKPAQEIVSRFGLDLLVERGQARQACDEGVAANYPGNISSSLPQQHAPIEVTALTPSLGWRQEKEDEKNVASAVEKGEGVPERRFDSVEFSPPGTRDRPRSSQTVRGYERDERASVGNLVDRYGAAASIPPGRPLAVGASGTPVPIKWGEEDTVRGRQRQRKLYMLATTNTNASKMSSNGSFSKIPQEKSGEGEGGSRWVSRVPWELLDELEAEKRKLRMWKIWSGHAC